MQRLKTRYLKKIVLFIFSFAVMSCAKEQADISYQGLNTINELDNLEPSLATDVDPDFFAPWIETGRVRSLTTAEALALKGNISQLFKPDELGHTMISSQFSLFTQRLRPRLEKWLLRSDDHIIVVSEMFTQGDLPAELSYLPFIESGYSTKAVSHAGASGLWQFMPATGRRFGLACCEKVDERNDPLKSTLAATSYLRILYDKFGDWSLALASYNAGENKIGRLVKITGAKDFFELARLNDTIPHRYRLREETLLYVPRFIAIVKIMKNLKQLGFNLPNWYLYNPHSHIERIKTNEALAV